MSTAELKTKLIAEIKESENEELLMDIMRMVEWGKEDQSFYHLTDEQEALIRKAQAEVRAGHFLTHEEANKEIDEWLGK